MCFNTSITGYQEIISDPSYADQIINFTFPHVGNVGTNKEDHESDKIWTKENNKHRNNRSFKLQIFKTFKSVVKKIDSWDNWN